ncbi:redoxin domain-containing protein [Alteromonadaceae bacterium M269]|nr:redoxin domain-containing protein [Alteromonadaceae bacterium M269]
MKNKFILPLIMLNMLSGVGSLIMIFMTGGNPVWIGVLLTTLPLPFLLIVLTNVLKIARTSARLPVIQVLSLSGLGLVAHTLYNLNEPLTMPYKAALGITVFGALFVQWYVWSYSNYGRKKSSAITKGRALPDLRFTRLDNSQLSSSDFVGSKVLMVFFRANWCPFCMNQLKEVLNRAAELKKNNVQVKFISNQGVGLSSELAKSLDLPEHFEILQDDELKAAKALGIADIGGTPAGMSAYPADTVMATVITLDEKGFVTFGDETDNYRVRPHPDVFMPVLEKS